MNTVQPRDDAHSEMLLDLANHWRKCAAETANPHYSEIMRGTAKEFEWAAAKAANKRPLTG